MLEGVIYVDVLWVLHCLVYNLVAGNRVNSVSVLVCVRSLMIFDVAHVHLGHNHGLILF